MSESQAAAKITLIYAGISTRTAKSFVSGTLQAARRANLLQQFDKVTAGPLSSARLP